MSVDEEGHSIPLRSRFLYLYLYEQTRSTAVVWIHRSPTLCNGGWDSGLHIHIQPGCNCAEKDHRHAPVHRTLTRLPNFHSTTEVSLHAIRSQRMPCLRAP
ncbi:uncharacterized protein MYCGRDRAFT_97694 [Zymoseptoria tritici IPO323]|uniref:Uncharacterized protein n=1 Tax=Zymoseptoria tritici (strain CBS 115943 / IPO323) TaxID=336722 RepID=F9XR07_ZYMTI|nr:uncharacterized protein MYCGRDRAFT_97694 [Zymoseptoria tritici IPO323]EGP82329.1 hypothetical protein MYCGRDRAFT_97694 [Zymoseptoria tritici IPO323]